MAASELLALIGSILVFIDAVRSTIAGVAIARGLGMVTPVAMGAAFGVAALAFFGRPRDRANRLGRAGLFLAGAFCVSFIATGILTGVEAAHHVPGTEVASEIVDGISAALLVAVALLGAGAFFRRTATGSAGDPRWAGRLGLTSLVFAIAVLLGVASVILDAVFASDLGEPGGVSAGLGIVAGGQAIALAAAVVAAAAFLVSSQRQREGAPWLRQREGLLWIAAGTFAVAFFVWGIGGLVHAGASINSGTVKASLWLDAIQQFVFMGAATSAAVGFFLARQRAAKDADVGSRTPT